MSRFLGSESAKQRLRFVFALGLGLVTWACGEGDDPQGIACDFTYECMVGEVCDGGRCVSTQELLPVGEGGSEEPGAGGRGGVGGEGGAGGEGGGAGGSGGEAEGGEGGEDPESRATFVPDDYRRCFDSLECAVFGGDCLIEIPLSRPLPDGTDRIRLSDLDPTLEDGQGICGATCTNEPRICDSYTVQGPGGQSLPSTCQLVYVGESPYPEGPTALPFTLDLQAMARGVPYASICRLPFEHAEGHSPDFCAPCTEPAHCGEGDGCWLDRPYTQTPSGVCVQACEMERDCPVGFRCLDVEGDDPLLVGEEGSYCVPVAGTCGRCLDQDGDQRGVGTCGPIDAPFTEVDCDDGNPEAYFDPARPTHPFPRFCGDVDFNCNGVSDQVEQLGSEAHCAACGDTCAGQISNGMRGCVEGDDGWACTAICQPGFADCNGDVEDGCETELEESMIWARDRDGDGRGNPLELRYFCEGAVPPGWVQNTLDCDDDDPTVYGGGEDFFGLVLPAAPERCDGVDNDCNRLIDDGQVVAVDGAGAVVEVAGEGCDTGLLGVCAMGTYVCGVREDAQEGEPTRAMQCVPNRDPEAASEAAELCNGMDDNCDGQIDEDVDWFWEQGQTNPEGHGAPAPCVVPGGKGICGFGVYQCGIDTEGEAGWICVPNEPEDHDPMGDGIDQDCDGIDGVLEGSIFVRPVAGGGTLNGNDANDGSANAPVATLQRALALACATPGEPCADIYLDQGTYVSDEAITLPTPLASNALPHVRIYGGFASAIGCDDDDVCSLSWERGEGGHSTLLRTAPPPVGGLAPFGSKYVAIDADDDEAAAPMELLLDRVNVQVAAPDPSYQLPEGASAPTQVGIECPSQGCSRLTLKDVVVDVADASGGAAGAPGAMGAMPTNGSNNGKNGCSHEDSSCNKQFTSWEKTKSCLSGTSYPSGANTDYRTVAGFCADGKRPHGGSSGGVGCVDGKDVEAQLHGFPGTGARDLFEALMDFIKGRGSDGAVGAGGNHVRIQNQPALAYRGGPVLGWGYQEARPGTSGNGGPGGSGTGIKINFFFKKGFQSLQRGGGGGAGGCNGTQGRRGGHGGNAIGMVLVSPSSGSLDFVTPGAFELKVGRGGSGGKGGAGGAGVAGGWGGSGRPSEEDADHRGGEGGDGGGGGGGGGGHGGLSVGIWQVCSRAGVTDAAACGIRLPSLLRASPDLFITPGQAGVGGEGGEGGKRGEKTMHMHQRVDTDAQKAKASDGAPGLDGDQHYLLFTGDGR